VTGDWAGINRKRASFNLFEKDARQIGPGIGVKNPKTFEMKTSTSFWASQEHSTLQQTTWESHFKLVGGSFIVHHYLLV